MATVTWNKCRRTSSDQSSPRAAERRTRNAFFGPASPTSSSSPSPPRRRDVLQSFMIYAVRPPRTDAVTEYRGVRYREELNMYVTEIWPAWSSKKIWLETYDTAEDTARAFDIRNLCCKKNLPLNFRDSQRMLKRISSQLLPDKARSAIAKLAKGFARVVINSTLDSKTVKRKVVDRAAALKAHELVQKKVKEPRPASEFQACYFETAGSSVMYTEQLEENIFVFKEDDTATAMPLTTLLSVCFACSSTAPLVAVLLHVTDHKPAKNGKAGCGRNQAGVCGEAERRFVEVNQAEGGRSGSEVPGGFGQCLVCNINTVYNMPPCTTRILALPALLLEGWGIIATWFNTQSSLFVPVLIIFLFGVSAFCLNFSIFYVIHATTAVTFNVAGNTKVAVAIVQTDCKEWLVQLCSASNTVQCGFNKPSVDLKHGFV